MYQIYVLRSDTDGNLYVGCTSNLRKRLQKHNDGQVKSTKARTPFRLIYTEKFDDKYLAFQQERFYKTAKGKKELKRKIN